MIVYLITNKVNGKRYVGQTTQKFENRIWQHFNDALVKKFPYPLHCAIRKYGKENFNYRILIKCNSIEELNHREMYLIRLFKTLVNNNGYNIRCGGSNSLLSEETKRKISISATGKKASKETLKKLSQSHLGRKLTAEHKEKLRITNMGRVLAPEARKKVSDSKKGKPRSEETKQKLREANLGKRASQETIEKLRLCRKNIISVECIENGVRYPSLSEAARQTGLGTHQVARSFRGEKIKAPFSFRKVS